MIRGSHPLRELQHHWPVTRVAAEWRARLGGDVVAQLRRCGLFVERSLRAGDTYPCPTPGGMGCPRQIVEFDGELVAICQHDPEGCDDLDLADQDAVALSMTPLSVRRALAAALALDRIASEPAPPAHRPLRLGTRRFGEVEVVFWFASRLQWSEHRDWLELQIARDRPRHLVLVLPSREAVEQPVVDQARTMDASLLFLDEELSVPTWCVDLSRIVLERRFPGVDPGVLLGQRYALVLDPEGRRHWFDGELLAGLERRSSAARFLEALAAAAGQVVSRHELCGELWPDEYGGKGWTTINWDRRLRDQRRSLSAVPRADSLPIETKAHADDTVGGYRLALHDHQIAWWSTPA